MMPEIGQYIHITKYFDDEIDCIVKVLSFDEKHGYEIAMHEMDIYDKHIWVLEDNFKHYEYKIISKLEVEYYE